VDPLETLRYPIGRFEKPAQAGPEDLARWTRELASVPEELRRAVDGLSDEQLDTSYRPGGWTVRQVAHHIADALTQQYTRFKLGLTEREPRIATFEEEEWARLADSAKLPVSPSLLVAEGLVQRWVVLLRSLDDSAFARIFIHPANGPTRLDELLAFAAWHGKHHIAQITSLRQRNGW